MVIKVTRYGGPMAGMKPRTKVFALEDLDAPTRKALGALLENSTPPGVSERIPDGFVYSFQTDEAGGPRKEVEVSGTHVPDALRKLLP
jgi:hypothetical protein